MLFEFFSLETCLPAARKLPDSIQSSNIGQHFQLVFYKNANASRAQGHRCPVSTVLRMDLVEAVWFCSVPVPGILLPVAANITLPGTCLSFASADRMEAF